MSIKNHVRILLSIFHYSDEHILPIVHMYQRWGDEMDSNAF